MKKCKVMLGGLLATVMMTGACVGLVGCGNNVEGTYTAVISSDTYFADAAVKEDLANDPGKYVKLPRLFGFLTRYTEDGPNVADFYSATLELKGGNYTLTKAIKMDSDPEKAAMVGLPEGTDPCMTLIFTGTYEVKGDQVTLSTPTHVGGDVVVAGAGAAYTRFGANYADIDVAVADIDDIMYPGKFFYYFNTMYFVDSGEMTAMNVSLTKTDSVMTFTVE